MRIESYQSFEEASRAALEHLYSRFGFALWMVTRTDGDDWNILYTEDHGYDIEEGATFRWSDSFCMRMVSGQGPRFAPRTAEIPAYVSAEIGQKIEIGSYIGMPLTRPDGSLFGTMCAIDPVEHGGLSQLDQDLIELIAKLLSTVLSRELETIEQTRRLAASGQGLDRDPETGLLDRAGWQQVLHNEDARARHFGSPACVLAVELGRHDDSAAAQQTLESAVARVAECLSRLVRETDFAARIDESRFAVLMVECDPQGGARLHNMLSQQLTDEGVHASVGWATREPDSGLEGAWQRALEGAWQRALESIAQ